MSFCKNCGAKLDKAARFRSNCGAEISVKTAPMEESVEIQTGAGEGERPHLMQYKGVGIRLVAHLVDVVVVFIFYFAVGSLIAGMVGGATEGGFELQGGPALLLILITFVVSMAYFIILECKWNGQTLGKKLVGIRVISEAGGAITFQQAAVRNLLRLVDALPFLYLVGIILIWMSDKRQRLGDRVANTVVVHSGLVARKKESKDGKDSGIRFSMGRNSGYLD